MIDRELIMATLMARLMRPPAIYAFTADIFAGDPQLYGLSDTSQFRVGMPIGMVSPSAAGIQTGAIIQTVEPTVTMSLPAIESKTQVPLQQGFLTMSRKYGEPGGDYPHPAFFLVDWAEDYPSDHAVHARATYEAGIVTLMAIGHIHAKITNSVTVPATIGNALLQALEQVLEPPQDSILGMKQTLGLRCVQHACIQGRVVKDAHELAYMTYQVPFVIEVAQGEDVTLDPTDPNYLP